MNSILQYFKTFYNKKIYIKNISISFKEIIRKYMYKGVNIKKTNNYFIITSLIGFVPINYFSKMVSQIGIVWENEIKYWDNEKKENKLSKTAIKNQYRLALVLLNNGVNFNVQDDIGNTPLHLASYKGNLEMAQLFIEHKANIESSTISMENKPLHRAAYNGKTNMCKLLLDNHANIECLCRYGHTPIFAAAHYGRLSTLKFLVSKKANLHHTNNLEQSILHVVAHKCKKNTEKIINFLLNSGISIEFKVGQGFTPLHSSCFFGIMDITKILCTSGANQESVGITGFTPLLSAVLGCRTNIIKYLLDSGSYWDIESAGP